jgi:hypothetical protein
MRKVELTWCNQTICVHDTYAASTASRHGRGRTRALTVVQGLISGLVFLEMEQFFFFCEQEMEQFWP